MTSHSQTLSVLAAGTLYHFRVKSQDAAANLATSADFTFSTPAKAVLSSLTVSPTKVVGGEQPYPTGTVTLVGPAPNGGVIVNLTSSNSHVVVPANVTIPAGATSVSFTMTTTPPSSKTRNVTITANYNGVSKTAVLTITRT